MKKRKRTPEPQTLQFYLDTAYTPVRLAHATAKTKYDYGLELRRFNEFLGRPGVLSDLNDETVSRAVVWAQNEKGFSPATAEKFHDLLCALWRFLSRRRIKGVNGEPTILAPRVPSRIPTAWTREQLDRLWEALHRLPGELAGVPASLFFLGLHSILWDTGERIGAVMKCRWKDLDLAAGWIVVPSKIRKGNFGDHLSKLHPQTVGILKSIVLPERELIFDWPYSDEYLYIVYKGILRGAGLPFDRERMFHALRRSVASHTRAAGGDASQVLGHLDPNQIRNYIDPRISPDQHAADVLFRPGPKREPDGQGDSRDAAK